jgi:hypothetical protein
MQTHVNSIILKSRLSCQRNTKPELQLSLSLLRLSSFVPQKYISLGCTLDQNFYLVVILLQMTHVVCRLPLHMKCETLGVPASLFGMFVLKEMTPVHDGRFHQL